ncbi:MAG: hypothetical protein HDQ99_14640 [Lachnospiraceae bacterium]|nr:hypothetical protein [Lachnospiraceae bacterium]
MAEEQYKELLSQIKRSRQGIPLAVDDDNLNSIAAAQRKEQEEEYNKRNKLYTELLREYILRYNKKEAEKAIYKGIFFSVIMFMFVAIVICGSVGLLLLSMYGDGTMANVGIAIANIAGIISSLIILPKIIAEHLFPVDEESNMIGMVRNMQENDANIRNVIFDKGAANKNENKRD